MEHSGFRAGSPIEPSKAVSLSMASLQRAAARSYRNLWSGIANGFQATPSLFAAQGYDAARLAVEAIKRGATTGEGVRDFLMMQHDLPTLSGPSGFSPDGTLNRRVFLIQVKQGRFVPLD
jgi:ABC-type branched-subunit amino acid transport system substrate-binding protein